jgi:lipopolysaccharide/colanic/teichoic acid biosynthesis glycosyltransferase
VRPGLTGYAQVHGRNSISKYVQLIFKIYLAVFSFLKDVKSNIETLKDKKNFF